MSYMDETIARADASRAAKGTKLTAGDAKALLLAASRPTGRVPHSSTLDKLRVIVRGGGQ